MRWLKLGNILLYTSSQVITKILLQGGMWLCVGGSIYWFCAKCSTLKKT